MPRPTLIPSLVALALIAACQAQVQKPTTAAAGAPAVPTILVGVAGPMSGEFAAFGEQMKLGAERAVTDINARGGVLGKNLALTIGDDSCDPRQAVEVAKEFASKGIVFVAGHFCSGASIPASSVYHDNDILQITPASSHPRLTDDATGWGTIFRTCARDDQQGTFAGAWIAQHDKGKNVAIIDDGSTYGQLLANAARSAMNGAGLREVLDDEITTGEADYSALVGKLKAANVDVIYFGGYHAEAARIIKQARQQGLSAQFLAGDALNTREFVTIAGSASDGVMFTNAADSRNLPSAQAVVAEFRKDGVDPAGYTLSTYAAIQVWAEAVTKSGTTDSMKVAGTLHSQSWNSVIGDISFDTKGDLKSPLLVWYVFRNGSYVQAGM